MLLSALSFLVVAQSSSEVPEGLMNNPVLFALALCVIAVSASMSIINANVGLTSIWQITLLACCK